MIDLVLRLRQIELATRAHRSSAGSSSVFLAIVQWKSRSAFARVSVDLWRKSRAEPRVGRQSSSCGSARHCREAGKTGRIGNEIRSVDWQTFAQRPTPVREADA